MTDVVPEDKSVLDGASIIGGRLIVEYLADVKSEVRRYTLDGKPDGTVALPGIGSAGGIWRRPGRSRNVLQLHQLRDADDDLSL